MKRLLPAILLLASVAPCGCTGTPMPIPPSFDPWALSVSEEPVSEECPLGCVTILGGADAATPGSVVMIHRGGGDPMAVPSAADTVADELGQFELRLEGTAEGVFRAAVHAEAESLALAFVVFRDETPGPWPCGSVDAEGPTNCIVLDPPVVDFGPVAEGEVGTAVVNVLNACEEDMQLFETVTVYVPSVEPIAPFSGLVRTPTTLMPGDQTRLLVVFWPETAGVAEGVVVLTANAMISATTLMPSVAVRGEGAGAR